MTNVIFVFFTNNILKANFPVLLTCEKEIVKIPFVPFTQILKAMEKEPQVIGADGVIPFQREKLGLKGSPTQVKKVFTPELKKRGKIYDLKEVSLEEAIKEIIGILKNKGLL